MNAKTQSQGDGSPASETVPPLSFVAVPQNIVKAALACVAKDETRFYLQGLFLHHVPGESFLRCVSTDGLRLFIAAIDHDGDLPEWADAGVIVPAEHLRLQAATIAKVQETHKDVYIGYASGAGRLHIADSSRQALLMTSAIDGTFPDYSKIVGASAASFLAAEEPADFEPVILDAKLMKSVGEIALALAGKGSKDAPSGVTCYRGDAKQPQVLTFQVQPGATLFLMPMRGSDVARLGDRNAMILEPAVKASLAALKAHETRNREAATTAKTKAEAADFTAKADGFAARMTAILKRTLEPALPPPSAAVEPPAPDPDAKPLDGDQYRLSAAIEAPEPSNADKRRAERAAKAAEREAKKQAKARDAEAAAAAAKGAKKAKRAKRRDQQNAVARAVGAKVVGGTPAAKAKPAKPSGKPGKRDPFETWQAKVSAKVEAKAGVTLSDLDDIPLRDWFDAKLAVGVAADRAIAYSKN